MNNSIELNEPWNWQDWIDMIAGVWLAASPWILGFADADPVAARNALIVGALIAIVSSLTFIAYHIVEEWISVLLGLWLVVSHWVLPTVPNATALADTVIVGLVVGGLAGWEIWGTRHGRPHPD